MVHEMNYLYLTVITSSSSLLFEKIQTKAPRNNDKENTIVLHLSVHFKVPKKTQKNTKISIEQELPLSLASPNLRARKEKNRIFQIDA